MSYQPSSDGAAGPTLLTVAIVCALGIGALYQVTRGFQALTTEDARRIAIAAQPMALPPARVRLPEAASLAAALENDGRVAIVTFIYTTCTEVCSVLGNQFQRMQRQIVERQLESKVRLISVSFDPRDTPEKLRDYARRMGARPDIWRFAAIDDAAERARMLDAVGIVVVPAPLGEFEHNAAFHLVSADARLRRIDDFDNPDLALQNAVAMADGSAP